MPQTIIAEGAGIQIPLNNYKQTRKLFLSKKVMRKLPSEPVGTATAIVSAEIRYSSCSLEIANGALQATR